MSHHPHVIAPNSERTMTQYIFPSDCRINSQLCTAPPQYLGAVIVCRLFSALLHPGDIRVLVGVGAVEDCGTGADVIGKVRHVGTIMTMTYH
jgi:hypothetical protein